LSAPVLQCLGGRVSWAEVSGASGYAYVIDDGAEQYTTLLTLTIEEGQSVKVKALGGDGYTDSEWSNTVSFVLAQLNKPVLQIEGNIVTWAAVEGADGYVYKINGGTEQETSETTLTLQNGESVVVKAKGDGITTSDSNWSTSVGYAAPCEVTVNIPTQGAGTVAGAGSFAKGTLVTLTATSAQGYTFAGWYVGGQFVYGELTYAFTVEEDVTIEARWNVNTYTVTFIADGEPFATQTVEYGKKATVPQGEPTKTGYTFDGWDFDFDTAITGEKTIEAKWIVNTYTVTFIADGEPFATQTVEYGKKATVPQGEPTKTGYTFDGWDFDFDTAITSEKTIEAKWTENAPVSQPLAVPVLSRDGGIVSWEAVPNASGYKYKIDDGEEETASGLSVPLEEGQSIVVKAVGDGVYYTDSAWSDSLLYTRFVLETPVVQTSGNLAVWEAVENASGYKYKIDGGQEQTTSERSVSLQDGQTIVVMALGEGDYKNSDWSVAVTYTATVLATPVVEMDGNVARWTAVENASGYKYKINGGAEQSTTDTFVALESGQSIEVKAVGDGTLYKDGAYSQAVTYQVTTLNAPVVKLDGNTATWEEVEGAIAYKYKIDGGEEQTTYEPSVALGVGQSVVVKAVGDNLKTLDSEYSAAVTYQAQYVLNVCESAEDITANATVSVVGSHATRGSSSVKVTTSEAWSQVNIRLMKDGKPLTRADLQNCRYITFDVYADQKDTRLFFLSHQLPTLVAGANTLRLSGSDILYQLEANAAAYDFTTGYGYFQIWDAGHTVYFDNFVANMGTKEEIPDNSDVEGVMDVLNDCETVAGWVEALQTPVLSTSNVYQGNSSVEATGTVGGWNLNVRIKETCPSLAELKATYDKIRLNVYSSYPNLEDGSPANTLWLGDATPEDFASRTVAVLRQGTNVVEVPTSMLDESMYISDAYGGKFLAFRVGGASTLRIDNVVGLKGAVDLGNVFIIGDSYSTFEEYIPYNSGAAWYTEVPRNTNASTVGEAQTDVTAASQTWWWQVIANSKSKLLTNASYSGTTVCNSTYGVTGGVVTDGSATSFTTRLQAFIDAGYFTQNRVDTFFLFGGTNDAWAYDQNMAAGASDYLGVPKYADWTAEDMRQILPAYAYLINQIKTNVPTARIVVLLNVSWTNANVVAGYKEICDHYGVEYVEAVLSASEVQQLHPNKAGMTAIKNQVLDHLG